MKSDDDLKWRCLNVEKGERHYWCNIGPIFSLLGWRNKGKILFFDVVCFVGKINFPSQLCQVQISRCRVFCSCMFLIHFANFVGSGLAWRFQRLIDIPMNRMSWKSGWREYYDFWIDRTSWVAFKMTLMYLNHLFPSEYGQSARMTDKSPIIWHTNGAAAVALTGAKGELKNWPFSLIGNGMDDIRRMACTLMKIWFTTSHASATNQLKFHQQSSLTRSNEGVIERRSKIKKLSDVLLKGRGDCREESQVWERGQRVQAII